LEKKGKKKKKNTYVLWREILMDDLLMNEMNPARNVVSKFCGTTS